MTAWPPILDERVESRLAMDAEAFSALARKLAARVGGRAYAPADFERAVAYPWERPSLSYWMQDGSVELLDTASAAAVDLGGEPRYPLVAFGSNGAPGVLAEKLTVLGIDERDVLVLAGELAGYDVVASAHVAIYGALPATIVPASGARVRAALLLVTAAQFTALTRTEFNYVVARLAGAPFASDIGVATPDEVFTYVSRNGSFAPDGEAAALQAVPAARRTLREFSQVDLLERAAALVLGEGAGAAEVVRQTVEDYAWAVEVARPALADAAEPFRPGDWELLGA